MKGYTKYCNQDHKATKRAIIITIKIYVNVTVLHIFECFRIPIIQIIWRSSTFKFYLLWGWLSARRPWISFSVR